MNILDAWKAAKVGQRLLRGNAGGIVKLRNKPAATTLYKTDNVCRLLDILAADEILADDWEVVKEQKVITCALYEILGLPAMHPALPFPAKLLGQDVPLKAKVTIKWEE